MTMDLVTVGRVSVDLYAQQVGASFNDPQTFHKSVGGSPTNVAVAAARYGRSAAVITGVGADLLGDYVVHQLAHWQVETRMINRFSGGQTPVVLAALDPPEDPKIEFYRGENAPDTQISRSSQLDSVVTDARCFWVSAGALAHGATAQSTFEWLEMRNRGDHTFLDLDYRASMWPNIEMAREATTRAIAGCTVVLGNRAECEMALELSDPDAAADSLLSSGVSLAIIKMGGGGVLLATAVERVRIDPLHIEVVCGLGAGDAFGGALVHGLLSGWSVSEIGEFANAAGAFVASVLTCADNMPTVEQVRQMPHAASVSLPKKE